MILIEAKRMDDERRMKRLGDAAKPAELRWKWVEDYCWRRGCFRSQNQCNDKWDNLMRDFKKIREFERREERNSYWKMERSERKDSNLPSNMLLQIYEALVAAVERKGQPTGVEKSTGQFLHSTVHPMLRSPMIPQSPAAQPLPTLDSGSQSKRRRLGGGEGEGGEGTSGTTATTLQEVGYEISRSASIIAEAIQSCENREDERHKEMASLYKRRLQIEESKAEINRRGINGLIDAINKLANSMLALAANTTQPSSK
ncbi:trihelix transcription factor ASR3-like isoform X3 [Salvia hispanica]|nr:trihelix transcription factor ASR3-like isoform X3 [Salvia hispanica]